MTPCSAVYDTFFTLITDDMYLEITKEETERDCYQLLLASIPSFEFPRQVITPTTEFDEISKQEVDYLTADLTLEEINILAYGMLLVWVQRQITTIDLLRQKYSGTDFKLTSQASHLKTLLNLQTTAETKFRKMQSLYGRRKVVDGRYQSTLGVLARKK